MYDPWRKGSSVAQHYTRLSERRAARPRKEACFVRYICLYCVLSIVEHAVVYVLEEMQYRFLRRENENTSFDDRRKAYTSSKAEGSHTSIHRCLYFDFYYFYYANKMYGLSVSAVSWSNRIKSNSRSLLLLHSFDHVGDHEVEHGLPRVPIFLGELVVQDFLHRVHYRAFHNREVLWLDPVPDVPLAQIEQVLLEGVEVGSQKTDCHIDHVDHDMGLAEETRVLLDVFVGLEVEHRLGLGLEFEDSVEDEFSGPVLVILALLEPIPASGNVHDGAVTDVGHGFEREKRERARMKQVVEDEVSKETSRFEAKPKL